MIRLENVSKNYESNAQTITALRNINLQVPQGAVLGIIGPSGAGKSTLMRCLCLLENPSSGRIWLRDKELTNSSVQDLRLARQQIGMIFQNFNLLSSRTVRENIAFPLQLRGMHRSDIDRRVQELLHLVGLIDKGCAYPAELSGGQKQRVGIARALAAQPQLLLSDEATSALDPETTHSILQLLQSINRQMGLTIILITHEMQIIKDICTHVAVLHAGSIVEKGRVESVLLDPIHPVTQNLVGNLFPAQLPKNLLPMLTKENNMKLLHLRFKGETARQPIIAQMAQQYDIQANILCGNIDHLQNKSFGSLIVEVPADAPRLQQAISGLHNTGIQVEVLKRND